MPTEKNRLFMNDQVTIRMPLDLRNRADRLATDAFQTRGAWMRSAVLEKVRRDEKLTRKESEQD